MDKLDFSSLGANGGLPKESKTPTEGFQFERTSHDELEDILGQSINQSILLQVLLINQSKMFAQMFPDKTQEEHYADFMAQKEALVKSMLDTMNEHQENEGE